MRCVGFYLFVPVHWFQRDFAELHGFEAAGGLGLRLLRRIQEPGSGAGTGTSQKSNPRKGTGGYAQLLFLFVVFWEVVAPCMSLMYTLCVGLYGVISSCQSPLCYGGFPKYGSRPK